MARNFYKTLFEENPAITAGFHKWAAGQKQREADDAADAERAQNSTAAMSGPKHDLATKPTPGSSSEYIRNNSVPSTGEQLEKNTLMNRAVSKVREYGSAAKDWAAANPGKAAAIGAATAAGLGALAFRKKIAEKLRKNK